LVRATYKICGAKKAQVELLHMVPVPDQVPLSDAEKYMMEGREGIVETMLYLAPHFPISTTIRYCRNIARGIISAVREKKSDMIVMGWRAPQRRDFRMGPNLDPIIERCPCNIVLLKDYQNMEYKRILVPLAGGPNGSFALEVASILAEEGEGEILALTVDTGKVRFDIGNYVRSNKDSLHLPLERVHSKVIYSKNVVDGILKEAKDYDLIVLGSSNAPLLVNLSRESVPETVARKYDKPLVVVKASLGIQSIVKRWL